jgi:hypothetical protein
MSIEQKIAEMLAESRGKTVSEEVLDEDVVELDEGSGTPAEVGGQETSNLPAATKEMNPDSDRNNKDNADEQAKGTTKKPNVTTANAQAGDQSVIRIGDTVKEDVDALVNGEDLSEEFKAKAATIFEAAIVARVKQEVANLEEEFEAKLEEAAAQNQEGLVEKVDGYLNYVVETWIAQNEIALERGMKSEILENFVSGLKGVFEENYIDIPEEKYDVVAEMEETIDELQAKLNEQLEANVEMNKIIAEQARIDIVKEACNGLTDTEVEKFTGLAEELVFEDADTFATKVQTIRENYFTNKVASKIIAESVVTDTPVEVLAEEVVVAPQMKRYMNALNNLK